mgnify:CR=1 FL=1
MGSTIWWIRRDLRLADNQTLAAAMLHGDEIIPVFILDPFFTQNRGAHLRRSDFLHAGLQYLNSSLARSGSRLIIRRGKPVDVLSQLTSEYSVGGIYAEADFSSYARQRDNSIAQSLPLKLVGSAGFSHPSEVVKADGSPYTVFTPFMKAWHSRHLPSRTDLLQAPGHIATPGDIASEALPHVGCVLDASQFHAGEAEATRRLEAFTGGIDAPLFAYQDQRDRMDRGGTSALSPYLRFGMLSARQAMVAAREAAQLSANQTGEDGAETWLNELIWREFYISILYHFPEVTRHSFRPEMRGIRWRNDPAEFNAWRNGTTGFPVVDAGMRQLAATGWMHNRARMITASFLVKDLLVDWRWGEAYFMRQLVDGDPAANNGGWQWTAGTGTDAAPYFRIFNPVLQGQKFDPQGSYIRKWVPELSRVPDEHIHQPWRMPELLQANTGCRLGKDYPFPMLDHQARRQMALEMYKIV